MLVCLCFLLVLLGFIRSCFLVFLLIFVCLPSFLCKVICRDNQGLAYRDLPLRWLRVCSIGYLGLLRAGYHLTPFHKLRLRSQLGLWVSECKASRGPLRAHSLLALGKRTLTSSRHWLCISLKSKLSVKGSSHLGWASSPDHCCSSPHAVPVQKPPVTRDQKCFGAEVL